LDTPLQKSSTAAAGDDEAESNAGHARKAESHAAEACGQSVCAGRKR